MTIDNNDSITFDASKVRAFFKKNTVIISFILLAFIIILAIYVRTNNIDQLKDVTTGNYTIGPDLDPFLYLRNARQILAGTLTNPDTFHSAPLGVSPYAASSLMPWAMVYLYKFMNLFTPTQLAYAADILPVILTSFAVLFFFLFVQKAFSYMMRKEFSYFGALVASLLYAVIPQMIHRTTAGIPEIESLGMPFFWLAFYFFLSAWQSEKFKNSIIYSILSGISTAIMIWSWGGYKYIFMTFSLAVFFTFFFQKLEKKNILVFAIWWFISLVSLCIKPGATLNGLIGSIPDILFSSIVLFIILVDLLFYDVIMKNKTHKIKFDRKITSLSISAILGIILSTIVMGPGFILSKISGLFNYLTTPFGTQRIALTVAENKAPYFADVYNSFAVNFFSTTISLFWPFFFGSILLFYFAIRHFDKKNRILLNSTFIIFITGFIFSRISSGSVLNGENFISQVVYFGSLIFIIFMIFFVYRKEKNNLENTFYKMNFSYIMLLSLMFFAIISMRGAVRLFFIISPAVIIAATYLFAKLADSSYLNFKDKSRFYIYISLAIVVGLFLAIISYNYEVQSYSETKYTVPGPYNIQWQKAMSWVRDNTPQNAIFAHWWDYGFWVQGLGERRTVTDGAHTNEIWDYFTARYLMTAESETTTLQLSKALNISYILFDSTDIGKYSAFSSIGSDKTGKDRFSYIPTYVMDDKQTQELKNETIWVYTGGFALDDDLIWNGIFLPRDKTGIVGFLVHNSNSTITNVEAVTYYNNNRLDIPINYIYLNNSLVRLSNTGLNSTLYLFPRVVDNTQINKIGAAFYLSEKVSNGEFARVYLLGQTNLQLVHKEDALLIDQIKQAYGLNSDFLLANDLYGPIKIFKVPDLSNIQYHQEYLEKGNLDSSDFGKLDYLGK